MEPERRTKVKRPSASSWRPVEDQASLGPRLRIRAVSPSMCLLKPLICETGEFVLSPVESVPNNCCFAINTTVNGKPQNCLLRKYA
jgi:hypothetical protein